MSASVSTKLVLAAAVALSGCAVGSATPATTAPTAPTNTTPPPADPPAPAGTFSITVERTACRGYCPAYTLTVDGTGEVLYEGKRAVAVPGAQTGTVDPAVVEQLRASVVASKFFEMEDCYCERTITDLPSVIVTVTDGDMKKRVEHYTGDKSAPSALGQLAAAVVNLAGADQWITGAGGELSISLERQPCLGKCPAYTVTISGGGAVTFEGKSHVAETGTQTATIPAEKVTRLRQMLTDANFDQMSDCYCERKVTDLPTAIITVTVDGKTKTVKHYMGDPSAPPALEALEDSIDAIAGTQRWIEGVQ